MVPVPPHGVIRMEVFDIVCNCNVATMLAKVDGGGHLKTKST